MARRKTILNAPTIPPTLEEQRAAALAKSNAALSVFYRAADDLVDAAEEMEYVKEASAQEAARYTTLSNAAADEANAYRQQADSIRALLGGNDTK